MTKDKYDKMIDQFEYYYDYLFAQTVDWWPSGRSAITVKLKDGTLMEYEYFENTIRRIETDRYTNDAEMIRRSVGHNLKKVIQTRGMAQADIAAKCGITEAMLSRYIHGTSMPGLDKVHALSAILGCRVIDIIGESYEDQ